MSQFTGKVALITGSGRGMGRSLAERGADIIVHDINEEWAEETGRLVRAKGRSALVARADVAKPTAMAEVVRRAETEFGHIDILINNAGVAAERFGIEEITEEWYERM